MAVVVTQIILPRCNCHCNPTKLVAWPKKNPQLWRQAYFTQITPFLYWRDNFKLIFSAIFCWQREKGTLAYWTHNRPLCPSSICWDRPGTKRWLLYAFFEPVKLKISLPLLAILSNQYGVTVVVPILFVPLFLVGFGGNLLVVLVVTFNRQV